MAAKFHISKKGNPAICRATKSCPLGDVPHFATKVEAENFLQDTLEKAYNAFPTTTKAGQKTLKELEEKLSLAEEDSSAWSAEDYLHKVLGDEVTFKETIEEPDYFNSTIVEKDGEHLLVRTSGGEWSSFEFLQATRVVPAVKNVSETEAEYKEKISSPRLNKTLREVRDRTKLFRPMSDGAGYILTLNEHINEEIERADGSKIYVFGIEAPGDRSLHSEPKPIDVPVDFYENGERQNAREMDHGMVIYDTRTQEGVLMKTRGASDGYSESYYYHWNGRSFNPEPKTVKGAGSYSYSSEPGSVYHLKGTGTTKASTYYKKSE